MGLASALLSFAHGLFGPGIWPGDWVWATSTAGALVALLPALGAMIVAIIRKGTGNRYDVVTLSIFGGIGVVAVFLLPWLLATGASQVYQEAASPKGGDSGFSSSDLSTFNADYSPLVGKQSAYLGQGQNVYEVLFYPNGMQLSYIFYLILLVGLPALSLLFVMLQARTAFRRGPKWPSRFFWIPLVLMVLASVGMGANTAVHFWLGFLPLSVLGLIPVALVGPPPWSTRAVRRRCRPAGPASRRSRPASALRGTP